MAPLIEEVAVSEAENNANGHASTPKANGKGKGKPKSQTKERIQRLDQLYSKKKRDTYFVPTPKAQERGKQTHSSHVVLKVRRIICDQGYPSGTEIDIKSDYVKDALKEIFEGVDGLSLNESPPSADPELFFHARDGLDDMVAKETAKEAPNKALIEELNVARQYIAEDHGSTFERLDSLLKHGEISFDLLWTLFPANTVVYTKSNIFREDQVVKLTSATYQARPNGSRTFNADLQQISHDGQRLGWTTISLRIEQFAGASKVTGLSFFPLKFHPEQQTLSLQLQQRGQKFLDLLQPSCKEYTGIAIAENREIVLNGEYKKFSTHISGRIMTDPIALIQQHPGSDLLKPEVDTEDKNNELTRTSIPPADLLFCTPSIGGFSFRQKTWLNLAVSRTTDVHWNPRAFDKLVMDPHKRDLVHALVRSHRNTEGTYDDVISGKGLGLVGLLSGNPGVGKTLTAEAIAEVTKRPLYMLSAGELGDNVSQVESRLDMILEVARSWASVLLIDEADVFLQARDEVGLERNALVSVFLRRLEYFQGVLIMTTNRSSNIDRAFDSRIHFKLHYRDLTAASRETVWRNCLENVCSAVSTAKITDEILKELAKLELNGRQIKNVIACAVSIAVDEKKDLSMDGIRAILDMVVDRDGVE